MGTFCEGSRLSRELYLHGTLPTAVIFRKQPSIDNWQYENMCLSLYSLWIWMCGTIAQGSRRLYSPCRQEPASLYVESHRLQHTAQCRNHTDCHTHTQIIRDMNTKTTDLLYTNCSHGWFSGKAGLKVAQNFLHALKEADNIIWLLLLYCVLLLMYHFVIQVQK